MIVIDTSVAYAILDANDGDHIAARRWYETADDQLATTPLVIAEIDHLAAARAGSQALRAFRNDVATGAYLIEWWSTAASESVEIAERHMDLGLSLTDASLVALAARLDTVAVATLDERHFRAVRPLAVGPAFSLLPADVQA